MTGVKGKQDIWYGSFLQYSRIYGLIEKGCVPPQTNQLKITMATFDEEAFYKRHDVSQVRQSQMISLPSESCIDR